MNAPPALASTPRVLDAPAASRDRRERRRATQHLGAPRLGLRNRGSRVAPSARRLRVGLRASEAPKSTGENPCGYGERATESSIARDYDPIAGRWAAQDPIRFDGRQSNLCVYVGDDPVNRTDPQGTGWGDDLADWLGKAVANFLYAELACNPPAKQCNTKEWCEEQAGLCMIAKHTDPKCCEESRVQCLACPNNTKPYGFASCSQ